jgi:hypothetical protein
MAILGFAEVREPGISWDLLRPQIEGSKFNLNSKRAVNTYEKVLTHFLHIPYHTLGHASSFSSAMKQLAEDKINKKQKLGNCTKPTTVNP